MIIQEIADGSISKESLMKEYEILRSTLEYTKQEYQNLNV